MSNINVRPIGDRVLVKSDPVSEKTAGGLYLPDTAKEKPTQGTLVAVGEGLFSEATGTIVPLPVQAGQKVLYGKYSGTEIEFEGQEYMIMRVSDLYAVV